MANYFYDVFYNIKHLSLEQKLELLNDAKSLSKFWHFDIINNNTWCRERIKYTRYKTALKYLDNKSHFVFIHRKGYDDWKGKYFYTNWCIEVGFSTNNKYLFVYIPIKHINFFIEKYKLFTI